VFPAVSTVCHAGSVCVGGCHCFPSIAQVHAPGSPKQDGARALLSTLITVLLTVIPLVFLLLAISNELTGLYQSLAAKSAGAGGIVPYLLHGSERLSSWATQRFAIPALDLRGFLLSRVESISSSLLHFSANLANNIFSLVTNALIALVVLFFLFRDGDRLVAKLMEFLPMDPARISELQTRVTTTVNTNFYGNFVVGALQGTLTGISFWALGIDSPVLWGIAAALFSLVPFVGTAIVWGPAAIMLLLTGHVWKGVILLGLGTAVIGTIDNIVRPLIVHKGVRLHPILVFFSLLGGLRLFGVLGLFVGPVIVSVTAALLEMFKQDIVPNPQNESKEIGSAR
jgi:predicted PurR-regulated permease PerM